MAQTIIGVNDAKAVKKFGGFLAYDTARKGYWSKKFMGTGKTTSMPIQMLTELEKEPGEQITFDLLLQFKGKPTYGDETRKGKEEDLKFATDSVYIDQVRHSFNTGGSMTRKRTIYDLRVRGRQLASEYWARLFDEYFFMYASGARGVNSEFVESTSFTGFANNSFVAPDAAHIMYSGDATSKASVDANDKLTLTTIDKAVVKARTMGGGGQKIPQIQPVKVDGENHYVLVMSEYDAYNVRTNANTGQWLDIAKAAAAAEGRKSPIFKGALGYYNNVVLHSHPNVIRFSDYGAGSNVAASRSLFLGAQAMVCAFGVPGSGMRFDWTEETEDGGNQLLIFTATKVGIKKTAFTIEGTSRDFGVISIDSAAADPNP